MWCTIIFASYVSIYVQCFKKTGQDPIYAVNGPNSKGHCTMKKCCHCLASLAVTGRILEKFGFLHVFVYFDLHFSYFYCFLWHLFGKYWLKSKQNNQKRVQIQIFPIFCQWLHEHVAQCNSSRTQCKRIKIVAITTISNFSNVHHAPASSYLQLVSCATRNTCNSSDKGVILATHQIRF